MNELTQIEQLSSADEVFHTLSPRNSRWGSGWELDFMFRGHQFATWQLLPSVWRPGSEAAAIVQQVASSSKNDINELWAASSYADKNLPLRRQAFNQLVAENYLVDDFVWFADQLGVPVSIRDVSRLGKSKRNDLVAWGWLMHYGPSEHVAAAQHSGLPTRLLDWTANPYFALFFAVEHVRSEQVEPVAVYALTRDLKPHVSMSMSHHVEKYTPPMSRNQYLRAQAGAFTYVADAEDFFAFHGRWPTLQQSLLPGRGSLVKVEFAASLAPIIRRELYRMGITSAHLRPTHERVASTVMSRWMS